MDEAKDDNEFIGDIHRVKLLELMNEWQEQAKGNIPEPQERSGNVTAELYRAKLLELMTEWHDQVKEFRRLSMATEHPVEVTRMRAKADTLDYNRREILLFIEEMDLTEEDSPE